MDCFLSFNIIGFSSPLPCRQADLGGGLIYNVSGPLCHLVCSLQTECYSVSGPLCHLVRSLQTEHYSAEDTLYQTLTPWWKPYPSTRAYTRAGL